MTYCVDSDVMGRIAHVKIPSGVLASVQREIAHTEININVRKLYIVPINSTDQTDMDFLRDIEADLAGGKLLLDISTVQQIDTLHALGMELIKRSQINLSKLTSENVVLIGAEKDLDSSDAMVNFPRVSLDSPDEYDSFNRRPSGVEQDAVDGIINTREYSSLGDTFKDENYVQNNANRRG